MRVWEKETMGHHWVFFQDYFLYEWMRATHNAARMYVCICQLWLLLSTCDLEFCRAGRILGKRGIVNQHCCMYARFFGLFLFLCISLRRVLVKIAIVFVPCTNHQCLYHCLGHSLAAGLTCCCQWCAHCLPKHTSLAPLILPKIHLIQKRFTHCLHGYAL